MRKTRNGINREKSKILELMDNLRADKYPRQTYDHIGRRGVRRVDGFEKASGEALYTFDVALPGMLYLRFLTSPYPHAKIVRMDTSKAEALPGVRAVLRYDDPDLPASADLGVTWFRRNVLFPTPPTFRERKQERRWRPIRRR